MAPTQAHHQTLTLHYTHSYSTVLCPGCLTAEQGNATRVETGRWEGKPTKPLVQECMLWTLFSRTENITNGAEQRWLPWL